MEFSVTREFAEFKDIFVQKMVKLGQRFLCRILIFKGPHMRIQKSPSLHGEKSHKSIKWLAWPGGPYAGILANDHARRPGHCAKTTLCFGETKMHGIMKPTGAPAKPLNGHIICC